MKDDEEFWDAVDEEESQSDRRVAVLSTDGDECNSLEQKLISVTVATDTGCCLPPSFNKKPLSNRQQPNTSGSVYYSTSSTVPETELPNVSRIINLPGDNSRAAVDMVNSTPGKMELSKAVLSPIAKVDTHPGRQQQQRLEKLTVVRDGQQPRDIMSPPQNGEEDVMSPHFTLVNQDTGEKFDLREIDKTPSPKLSPHHHEKRHSNIPQEQTRHNWRKAMSGEYVDNDKQFNEESEKKTSRWCRGKHQKKSSPGHDRHGSSVTPDGYAKKSGGRKDGFFGNFSLLQELGNVSEMSVTADDESSDTNIKRGHSGPIWALEFSHDGQFVAWGGEDGCIVVTRISSFTKDDKEVKSNESYNTTDSKAQQPIMSIPSTDTASDLVTGLLDKVPLHLFEGHTSDVICLAWSVSSFLLSSSKDMTVRLWHVTQPQCLHIFQHCEIVTSVHFHPTHEYFFLTGCFDKKVRIWNIKNGRVQEWQQAQDMITSARFSNDGAMVIVGLYRGQVLFYQTEGMRYFTQIECRNRRGAHRAGRMVTGLELRLASRSSPGKVGGAVVHGVPSPLEVLVTTNDSRLRLYQTDDFSMIAKFKGLVNEDNYLIRASFSEDGKYIVSGSESGKVILWSADSSCTSNLPTTHRNTAKPLDSLYAASDDSAIVIVSRFIPESSVLACVKNVRGNIDPKLLAAGSYCNSILATTDSSGVVRIYARQDIFIGG